ncbi:IS200/IS605 family transposase [uncultured Parasutterella sp.]|uniref:IS200/IS605 family transposase n=2 Tax=Parasutterella TaxID=577310 RepID=UPI002675FE00|nr:IS200/IS605 family transposase [uncultured Parasutterella sp.]
MNKSNDIRHGRHCVFNLHIHLVFLTKYRRSVFTKAVLEDLKEIFASVCQDFEAELVEFDGEKDHVHLLINYPPKVSVSRLVNSLKGVSSRLIRKKRYACIQDKLWAGALWSPSYFAASCGGAPFSIIKQYIEQQDTPE